MLCTCTSTTHHFTKAGLETYRVVPARLGGDLRVGVDAIKLAQSFLVNLLQVLLQRQVSICEEPGGHTKRD